MSTIDPKGRVWTRTEPARFVCEDGSVCIVGATWTDEQAQQAVIGMVLEQARTALDAAVERLLHSTAHALGYTDPEGGKHMDRAATYATSKVFGLEAQALVDWRDAVWVHCHAVLAAVENGERPIPTEAELLAELPGFAL